MQSIKKEINTIQNLIKNLKQNLNEKNINMELFLEEMLECLAFIDGYAEKSLEKEDE